MIRIQLLAIGIAKEGLIFDNAEDQDPIAKLDCIKISEFIESVFSVLKLSNFFL